MPIPSHAYEEVEAIFDKYCSQPIPEHARGKIGYGYLVRGMTVTLFEQYPHYKTKTKWVRIGIARFRFNKTQGLWTLYYRDRNHKWHIFPPVMPSKKLQVLLAAVEKDPTGIFWG